MAKGERQRENFGGRRWSPAAPRSAKRVCDLIQKREIGRRRPQINNESYARMSKFYRFIESKGVIVSGVGFVAS